jgi:hypothetical protein
MKSVLLQEMLEFRREQEAKFAEVDNRFLSAKQPSPRPNQQLSSPIQFKVIDRNGHETRVLHSEYGLLNRIAIGEEVRCVLQTQN